ncbi:MAG TPA: phosphotransferase [Candidatus Acidoferrales bacterium]|nr:phosphotransferase [Candidatus Acidoferrales bacterium]
MDAGGAFEDWAADAIARRWAGARVAEIDALRGDLSTRRFWRARISSAPDSGAPATAIVVDLGPDDLPRYVRALNLLSDAPVEPPWINVHRFFCSIGVPVPELYAAAPERRALLVEDVGELSLADAARQAGADVAELFRRATVELLRIHVEGSRAIDDRCVARRVDYDGRLFEWELKEFRESGLAAVAPGANEQSIAPELKSLAERLDRYPRVLSHRDYHGQNLYLDGSARIRVIDFQDALMAPAAQDLAVLLTTRDTDNVVTPAIERRILDFYYTGLVRRDAANLSADEFVTSYRLCVLQHALKMIGRFEVFERGGKRGYAAYIPHARAQAVRMMNELPGMFPKLRAALAGR